MISTGSKQPVQRTALIQPVDTSTPFPWTGILFGLAMILSPAYWIGNQAIVQRSLGARSAFEAQASYIWGAVLKNVIPLIIAVPGLIALAKFPALDDGDQSIPKLVSTLLPNGFRGIFVAAFVAALMSSIDSYLNAASTIFTHDLYRRFVNRELSDQRVLRIGRITTIALMGWAIFFAFITDPDSGIYAIFQTLMAFFQGPALAILLLGMLWKRATGRAAFVGFVAGVCVSISLFTLNQPAIYESLQWSPLFQIADPFLYLSLWAFLTTASIVVVGSLLTTPEPEEKVRDLVTLWKRRPKT